jgi:hypothetical protein
MELGDPFIFLAVEKDAACRFFGVFSRFEFAMKDIGFVMTDREEALPAWRTFAVEASRLVRFEPNSPPAEAVRVLIQQPPQVQNRDLIWGDKPLAGESDLARALESARRVRNNLFHGGKHAPYSPPGRDQQLLLASLTLLEGCLACMDRLRYSYETVVF